MNCYENILVYLAMSHMRSSKYSNYLHVRLSLLPLLFSICTSNLYASFLQDKNSYLLLFLSTDLQPRAHKDARMEAPVPLQTAAFVSVGGLDSHVQKVATYLFV